MVGINDEVRGVDHLHQILAKGPCIVASKHQSMWETFFLGLFLPRVCVIVKKQLLHIPLYGQYLERLRAIGIDRTQGVKALRTMINEGKKAIEAGYHILIFPEGNRSDPLEKPTYQSGIALLYEKMNVPVVPVALNAGFFWPRRKILKKPGTIVVHFLPPILPGMEKKAFLKRLEYDIENGCKNL
jgi:1-acyl-sn-glycerol-3-phosphate acyltransferase